VNGRAPAVGGAHDANAGRISLDLRPRGRAGHSGPAGARRPLPPPSGAGV